jgi:hypothetical protein
MPNKYSIAMFPPVLRAIKRQLPHVRDNDAAMLASLVCRDMLYHQRPDTGEIVFLDGVDVHEPRLQPMPSPLAENASEVDKNDHANRVSRLMATRMRLNEKDRVRTTAETAATFTDDDNSTEAKDARIDATLARLRAEGRDV